MAENTAITWSKHTVNFWWGCSEISPACDHCYARVMDARFHGGKATVSTGPDGAMKVRPYSYAPHWGPGPRLLRMEAAEREALRYERRAAREGVSPLVFVNSMSDLFEPHADLVQARRFALEVMRATPHLIWLVLTKRPAQILPLLREALDEARAEWEADGTPELDQFIAWLGDWLGGAPPANIWLGTTVEDQERANQRIPALLNVPAKLRYLSCEPLLGPLALRPVDDFSDRGHGRRWLGGPAGNAAGSPGIDWVICGGESGAKARPMQAQWARRLRDQCAEAGIPFHLKQWGEWCQPDQLPSDAFQRWDAHANAAGNPDLERPMRFGVGVTGRLLDGREHDEFPGAMGEPDGIMASRASA